MLDEYKASYEECANLISNWKTQTITDLANEYVRRNELNDLLSEAYLSAIICRYWNVISKSYYKQLVIIATPEDIYEWMLDGILDALKFHVWLDPNNKLYNDPLGADKAIKVCIGSARINFFNSMNYEKRKINKFIVSLEELQENSSDSFYIPYIDKSSFIDLYVYDKVRKFFIDYDYFSAFLLDSIVSADVFSNLSKNQFYELSVRKLIKHLRNLSDEYCSVFSNLYDIDLEKVKKAAQFIKNLSKDRMKRNIINLLFILKNDKELIDYIKDR